ncbi:polymorphic toxin type 44 domain-containing protein [Ruminococcus bromii]|uniref:polymorphic toxin type 44 domain-containing protein n=1 Tax=Ruminococcus bromii TaxID=40518 RepID=UPI003A90083C
MLTVLFPKTTLTQKGQLVRADLTTTAEAALAETTESNFCNLKFNILTIGPFQFANHFKLHGCIIASQDVGNIHFGFVGSVVFKAITLCTGAGIYQILSGTSSWSYWYSFFDDPRDTRCILLGRKYWRLLYNRKVFQW